MKSFITMLLIALLLNAINISAQKLNSVKSTTFEFISYSCGDGCYYEFTDLSTNEPFYSLFEFEFELNKNDNVFLREIYEKCGGEEQDCELIGQLYEVVLTYKKMPVYKYDGEGEFIKTKKKENKWVVTSFKKKK